MPRRRRWWGSVRRYRAAGQRERGLRGRRGGGGRPGGYRRGCRWDRRRRRRGDAGGRRPTRQAGWRPDRGGRRDPDISLVHAGEQRHRAEDQQHRGGRSQDRPNCPSTPHYRHRVIPFRGRRARSGSPPEPSPTLGPGRLPPFRRGPRPGRSAGSPRVRPDPPSCCRSSVPLPFGAPGGSDHLWRPPHRHHYGSLTSPGKHRPPNGGTNERKRQAPRNIEGGP